MNDEPIMVEFGFTGIDEGVNSLEDMAKEFRHLQRLLDDVNARAKEFAKGIQDTVAQAGQLGNLKISLPSLPAPVSSGSGFVGGSGGGSGGMAAAGQLISEATNLAGAFGGVAEAASVDLLGPLALVEPALKGFADALTSAIKSIASAANSFWDSKIKSGGTNAETGLLRGLGYATNTDMAALSRQFAERITAPGPAAAFARRAGIDDTPGPYGQIDKAANLLKAADYIHYTKSDDEAQRFARVEGLENLLKLRPLSDAVYEDFKKSAALTGNMFDPSKVAKYNLEIARYDMAMDHLKLALAEHFLPAATALIEDAATFLDTFNKGIDKLTELWNKLTGHGDDGAQQRQTNAEEQHTEAMREHAKALRAGTYGGGPNARAAIPPAWTGQNVRVWDGQARALGSMI